MSEEEVDIGSVAAEIDAAYGDNLQAALDACWKMVWHKFPSPQFPDRIADGFTVGVGESNKG